MTSPLTHALTRPLTYPLTAPLGSVMGQGGGGGVPSFITGLTHANTQKLRDAINGAINGTYRGRILDFGDSTKYGQYADTTPTSQKIMSQPFYLAGLLNAAGIPTEIDNFLGAGHNANPPVYTTYDPRVVCASFTLPSLSTDTTGGRYFNCIVDGGTMVFTPGVTFDTIDLYYTNPFNTTTISIVVGGVTVATVLNNPTPPTGQYMVVTIPLGSATSAVTIKNGGSTNSMRIVGIDAYTSGQNKLSLMGSGIPGGTASDWAKTNTNDSAATGLGVGAWDFVFDELTINDSVAGTAIATFKSAHTVLYNKSVLGGGQFAFIVGNQTDPAGGTSTATQDTYKQAVKDLAGTLGVPVIDMQDPAAFGTYADAVARGDMFNASHPLAVGYQRKAAVEMAFIQAAMAA